MKDRLVIINHNARLYQKSNKKVKTQILNELTRILRALSVKIPSVILKEKYSVVE